VSLYLTPYTVAIIALGGLAHIGCIVGVVLAFKKSSSKVSMRFGLAGLLAVLAIAVVSLAAYYCGLAAIQEGINLSSDFRIPAFEIQMRGTHYASSFLTLGLFASAVPFLVSLVLLISACLGPNDRQQPAMNLVSIFITTICFGTGLALLCSAMLAHLNFASFLAAMLSWITS
jgi:hypothetical protein